MTVTIEPVGDSACTLNERTVSSSAVFPIPISKPALIEALRTLLNDPDLRQASFGAVFIDRLRDGPRVHVGSGNFLIKYHDVIPLVLGA